MIKEHLPEPSDDTLILLFIISDWKYSTGFINDTMMKEHLPEPSYDTLILLFIIQIGSTVLVLSMIP